MEIILKNVRLSFPDLFKRGLPPKDKPNEPGKFGGQFIFAPDHEAAEQVKALILKEAQEKFGPNWQTIMSTLQKDKKCLRLGDQNLDKQGAIRDGYAGMLYVVAKNKLQPIIIGRNREPLVEAGGKPYGGCYVNAKVDIYAMDGTSKGFGRSVNATLLAVQFVEDGEAFGGSRPNADGFDDLGGGDGFGEAPAGTADVRDPLFG
jgi:hypothetical protein